MNDIENYFESGVIDPFGISPFMITNSLYNISGLLSILEIAGETVLDTTNFTAE